jgi:hypothetical protein
MNAYQRMIYILIVGSALTIFFYKIIDGGLKKYYVHRNNRVYEMFKDSTKYDILFIGSSRTHTTIYPKLIDSVTDRSSYNTGVDAGRMCDFKMTLDAFLLAHPNPSLVVFTIDPNSFNGDDKVFDPMQYFSLIRYNKVLANTLAQSGHKTFILKFIPWMNFIYMDDYSKNISISGYRGMKDVGPGEFEYKGYQSNSNDCISQTLFRNDSVLIKPNPVLVQMFQAMLDTCKKRNIQVMLTFAPEYKHEFSRSFKNIDAFNKVLDSMTRGNGLKIYRDDSLSMNSDSCLFRDIKHVNTSGGLLYSKILGERIRKY